MQAVADPTTLGLFGLAIVTFVASSQKLGITDGLSFVLPWAIFLGGLAQLIAAVFDFKHDTCSAQLPSAPTDYSGWVWAWAD